MKIELHNKLIDLAKLKKDGIYTREGYQYIVKNNGVLFTCDPFGKVYQMMGHFKTEVCTIEYKSDFKKIAKENKWV